MKLNSKLECGTPCKLVNGGFVVEYDEYNWLFCLDFEDVQHKIGFKMKLKAAKCLETTQEGDEGACFKIHKKTWAKTPFKSLFYL